MKQKDNLLATSDLININRVAKDLGVVSLTIKRWAKEGAFPTPFKIGTKYYFKETEVTNFINQKTQKTKQKLAS
ncbi:MAG: hypothetical protein JJV97_00215 [SAR324 cluster bacterium]|nr:hypothetical protein [SAR324 cluster bacterium]